MKACGRDHNQFDLKVMSNLGSEDEHKCVIEPMVNEHGYLIIQRMYDMDNDLLHFEVAIYAPGTWRQVVAHQPEDAPDAPLDE